jgi:hypothetical protein
LALLPGKGVNEIDINSSPADVISVNESGVPPRGFSTRSFLWLFSILDGVDRVRNDMPLRRAESNTCWWALVPVAGIRGT